MHRAGGQPIEEVKKTALFLPSVPRQTRRDDQLRHHDAKSTWVEGVHIQPSWATADPSLLQSGFFLQNAESDSRATRIYVEKPYTSVECFISRRNKLANNIFHMLFKTSPKHADTRSRSLENEIQLVKESAAAKRRAALVAAIARDWNDTGIRHVVLMSQNFIQTA